MTPDQYETFKAASGGETGMVWILTDDDNNPVGYIEPVHREEDPDPHILSFVNCANNDYNQNIRLVLTQRITILATRHRANDQGGSLVYNVKNV